MLYSNVFPSLLSFPLSPSTDSLFRLLHLRLSRSPPTAPLFSHLSPRSGRFHSATTRRSRSGRKHHRALVAGPGQHATDPLRLTNSLSLSLSLSDPPRNTLRSRISLTVQHEIFRGHRERENSVENGELLLENRTCTFSSRSDREIKFQKLRNLRRTNSDF